MIVISFDWWMLGVNVIKSFAFFFFDENDHITESHVSASRVGIKSCDTSQNNNATKYPITISHFRAHNFSPFYLSCVPPKLNSNQIRKVNCRRPQIVCGKHVEPTHKELKISRFHRSTQKLNFSSHLFLSRVSNRRRWNESSLKSFFELKEERKKEKICC